jgi:hypothetical protein
VDDKKQLLRVTQSMLPISLTIEKTHLSVTKSMTSRDNRFPDLLCFRFLIAPRTPDASTLSERIDEPSDLILLTC